MSQGALVDLIRSRRSVRRFKPEPVPGEMLEKLAEAALWAPRAGDRQHWRLVAVRDRLKKRIAEAVEEEIERQRSHVRSRRALAQFDAYTSHFTHFRGAPVVLVMVAKPYDSIYTRIVSKIPDVSMGVDFEPGIFSAAMAVENLLLAATALGLGSCYLSGPLVAHKRIAEMLDLGPGERVAGLIALGFADETPGDVPGETRSRSETIEEILSYR